MSIPALRKRVLNTQYTFACAVNGQLLDTLGTVTLPIWLGGEYCKQVVHLVRGGQHRLFCWVLISCYRLMLLWMLVMYCSALEMLTFLSCRPQTSYQNVVTSLCLLMLLFHLLAK